METCPNLVVQQYDVSVIITAHAEGGLVHRTLRSARLAVERARKENISAEIIVVLDTPTKPTQRYFETITIPELTISTVQVSDSGESRNHGIMMARGTWIAILDADDLFSPDWLVKAFRHAQNEAAPNVVLLPEYAVCFEGENSIKRHISSNEPSFDSATFLGTNYWISLVLARRSLFLNIPYVSTRPSSGFGYEDWHWICQVLGSGGKVVSVLGTCIFVRRKLNGSRLAGQNVRDSILPPTSFMDSKFLQSRAKPSPASLKTNPTFFKFLVLESLNLGLAVGKGIGRAIPGAPAVMRRLRNWRLRRREKLTREGLPAWLLDVWKAMSVIEPQLFPDKLTLETLIEHKMNNSPMGELLIATLLQIHETISHVFLLPWLKAGGADLVALNYIRAVHDSGAQQSILVLTTEEVNSPWTSKLPNGVTLIELGSMIRVLCRDDQRKLLGNLLVQLKPRIIHNINSMLGYEALSRYGNSICERSKVFVSAFCYDKTEEGKNVGFASDWIPRCFDQGFISSIFLDNQTFIDELHERFGIERESMICHYQPIDFKPGSELQARKPAATLEVLWAGRLCRQKHPEFVLEIANRCRSLPIRFHIYGTADQNSGYADMGKSNTTNVIFHGGFDRFTSLPVQNFDLFLNTSEWDGMPNVILEAISVGLPVLTSDAGGISELIVPNQTGLLVSPFNNIDGYVGALSGFLADRQLLGALARSALDLFHQRHNWEAFNAKLKQSGDYLGGIN